jgi:hypothetical protein
MLTRTEPAAGCVHPFALIGDRLAITIRNS